MKKNTVYTCTRIRIVKKKKNDPIRARRCEIFENPRIQRMKTTPRCAPHLLRALETYSVIFVSKQRLSSIPSNTPPRWWSTFMKISIALRARFAGRHLSFPLAIGHFGSGTFLRRALLKFVGTLRRKKKKKTDSSGYPKSMSAAS